MDKFLALHFEMDSESDITPPNSEIQISSDESMKCLSTGSAENLDDLSDTEDVALLAQWFERQMENPTTSPGNPIPDNKCSGTQGRPVTPRLLVSPGPMFDAGYFDLGMCRGPVARDPCLQNNKPINICTQLTPRVDTPLSPMRAITNQPGPSSSQEGKTGAHFKGPEAKESPYINGCIDCLVCGKNLEQIQDEAVIDYLHKTAVRGESMEQFKARRLAFLEGMKVGSFMLIPGGLSQLAACNGNLYSIQHNYQRALPVTMPLN